ncbi:MAG: cache domain-containing protein [Armatimonadota bacterium]|nr:cache domain-containing protein [Armatimonadota bacterium]
MGAVGRPAAWTTDAREALARLILRRDGIILPIATKLILSFLVVILVTVVALSVVGTRLIGHLIESEAETTVRNNLNAAREILLGRLNHVNYVVRLTAGRYVVRDALLARKVGQVSGDLSRIREREGLDFLTLADKDGVVLLRTSHAGATGGGLRHDGVVTAALERKEPVAAVTLVTLEDLRRESPHLAERARIRFVETPKARFRPDMELTAGLALMAAAPVLDASNHEIGVLYGGILLNRNYEIVDKIKETVFAKVQYRGQDIGTSTLFLDDVRIATNVRNPDGSRAIGTRIAEDVYQRVAVEGQPWIGRAYVVTNWYIAAYEPLRDLAGQVVGILYVGVLEQKYVDLRRRTVGVFLAIVLAGALTSAAVAYRISRGVSSSVTQLVSASRQVADGNLDARVHLRTNDELQDLADNFNRMAAALKERNEQLKDFAQRKIRESERLAIIGQLSAGVAHEINNPLQGIITYAHLLLEKAPPDSPLRASLQKIVNQADRCRDIVRGLLDFARPQTPQKRPTNVNALLQECVSLVENQALFHNIEIEKSLQPNLPSAYLDPSQVQQVFMNMIINAAEAMDGGGRLRLATRFDPAEAIIEVEITDTGHGIRPEDLERIFDPFFTTKGLGHGTGLGLAISYGIVKEHGGSIAVESEVGKGTSFFIRLPVGNAEAP